MRQVLFVCGVGCCFALTAAPTRAADPVDTSRGDDMIAAYFRAETARLAGACLKEIRSPDDWIARRDTYRQQLFEMLGLDPLPPRTDLAAVTTGTVERDDFIVEKLYFQSRPGLYVTGNLYLPKNLVGRAPAVLYLCGHGGVKKDGISYGNKVHYQHHGAWFARHGYVCLTIDTLQLGEIEGIHHGTYREGMWWWNARGYTPAGVEAWNSIRALDYLESRPEVDAERIGVTGRSGGGAYSWWVSALDDRIRAAVPVAGITDLENHVVDGVVEGHCDCMFMVNTYRWDYAQVAALVAPRALLISNSDKDGIFPLEGVIRVHRRVRDVYRLLGADDRLGLQITAGPHSDTQELRVHAFRWLNRFLKDETALIDKPAVEFFEPEELKVFDELPGDERNTTIHETFVPAAEPPETPTDASAWAATRDAWFEVLAAKCFRAWPDQPEPLDLQPATSAEAGDLRLEAYDFTSQGPVRLRLYLLRRASVERPPRVRLAILDEPQWARFVAAMRAGFAGQLADLPQVEPDEDALAAVLEALDATAPTTELAFIAPRGIGPTKWNQDAKKQIQIRRRFMLLGQTLDGMRTWDVRRAVEAVRGVPRLERAELILAGHATMAGLAVYAALFEPGVSRLALTDLPASHRDGPIYLNVNRFLDMPQALAMAAERTTVSLAARDVTQWNYPLAVARSLDWPPGRLDITSASPPAGSTSQPPAAGGGGCP